MNQQKPIVDYCKEHDIFVEAYAPLMRAQWDVPAILEVAKKVLTSIVKIGRAHV